MNLIPNELNKFSSFNYIWSFDVATRAEANSGSYKNKRCRIIRSGGIADTAGDALKTDDELKLGVKGEYFIDNVRMQAVVAPNPYSGITNATKIDFEVIEPYSIGLFLQTIQLAASEAGYDNYLHAPFILGVEFIGYDLNGAVSTVEKRVLLVKLVRARFSVTAAGSVYQVESVPWSHQALEDNVQKVSTHISIKGNTVSEVLTSLSGTGISTTTVSTPGGTEEVIGNSDGDARSLMQTLNEQQKELSNRVNGSIPDQYEILFPSDISEPGTTNTIANKKIAQSIAENGNVDFGIDEFHHIPETSIYQRGNLTIDANNRVYQFKEGTKIEEIIQEVILTSEWGDEALDQKPDAQGYVNWFKIFTKVEIFLGDNNVNPNGSPPLKYTYMVYPYRVHASTLSDRYQEMNYNRCIQDAVKGYNYTYTGENTDVINFDINIDYAWVQALSNRYGSSMAAKDPTSNLVFTKEDEATQNVSFDVGPPTRAKREPVSRVSRTNNAHSKSGGNARDTERTRVAKSFNDAIVNSNADLIKMEMTIWGDPYFIADSDAGNYVAKSGRIYLNSDGTMDYLRSEVDVLIKFAGAVDYKDSLLSPNVARQFSGVYKVIYVNSNFEAGVFTQELTMVRRPRQDDITIINTCSAIESLSTGSNFSLLPNRQGVAAGDIKLFLRQADEAEKMFNIFGQLNLGEITSALGLSPFGLISRLNGFTQLFDQARQIRSAVGNLGSLASSARLSGINAASIRQLTSELTEVQGFFSQAFSETNISSITQALNQDVSNISDQLKGASEGIVKITNEGVQGIPDKLFSPKLDSLTSIIRPQARPNTLSPSSTQLINTPNGPIRVIGTGPR